VTLLPFDVEAEETPQWIDAIVEDRDRLVEELRHHDVHCRPFWFPIHSQRPYARPDAEFPISTAMMPRAVWLPSALSLTEDDIDTVCRRIRRFYGVSP
jgi:perosamine synthetase